VSLGLLGPIRIARDATITRASFSNANALMSPAWESSSERSFVRCVATIRSSILSWRGFGRLWGGGLVGVPVRVLVAWRDCNSNSCSSIFRTRRKTDAILGILELD